MPIEATLTRSLNIRFIDARSLANEAKLSLGLFGYPSQDQEKMLVQEAIRIFQQSPEEVKCDMRTLRHNLETCKIPKGSMASHPSCSDVSVSSSEVPENDDNRSGKHRRSPGLFNLKRVKMF